MVRKKVAPHDEGATLVLLAGGGSLLQSVTQSNREWRDDSG